MNEIQHLVKPKDGPAPRWFHIAVALSMIISAISALVATLHTGQTMTALVEQNAKLVRAGSTPILEFGHGNVLDDGSSATFHSAPIASRSLAAGSDARILLWKKPNEDTPDLLRAWSALDEARFQTVAVEACFCSVFEECWTSSLNGDVPK